MRDTFNSKRYLGKPMGWMEDLQQNDSDIQGIDETDEEYKRRMRIKRNKELEGQGNP